MSKPKPKRRPTKRNMRTKSRARSASAPVAAATSDPSPRSRANTKGAKIIGLLNTPAGTTIAAMAETTGWQHHSVREFLAGVIRKKLGLSLTSQIGIDGRIYRIAKPAPTPAT